MSRRKDRARTPGLWIATNAKRLLIQTSAFNVGLLMRTLIGVGTPRGLQGRLAAVWALVVALWTRVVDLWRHDHTPSGDHAPAAHRIIVSNYFQSARQNGPFHHGLLGTRTGNSGRGRGPRESDR